MPRPSSLKPRFIGRGANDDTLVPLDCEFANPGNLRLLSFVPDDLPPHAPLVVVLHGCTQTAATYDRGSGWTTLADRLGFAVLYPEQDRANNGNGCFNWFEGSDTVRGGGEAASIAYAVAAMVARHRLDPTRVFVTGLSAGGAMAAVMLATYPDIFAGGAIIAGLPYGAASGVPQALGAMASPNAIAHSLLGDRVRAASSHAGPWPRVSIWHGGDDRTVNARNGELLAAQWVDVHGVGVDEVSETADGRHGCSVWRNAAGVAVVELNRINGMAHGTPLDGSDGSAAGPFMLDVGIASAARIADFWGLRADAARPRKASAAAPAKPHRSHELANVIADALRSAGLMR